MAGFFMLLIFGIKGEHKVTESLTRCDSGFVLYEMLCCGGLQAQVPVMKSGFSLTEIPGLLHR